MSSIPQMHMGKRVVLGIQHVFAMFGATVLVPLLTGLNPSIALLSAGIGTLLFHLCTKGKVPVFLGSSFAYIAGLQTVIQSNPDNIPKAMGGIICAGIMYILLSICVRIFGVERIKRLLPPVVTGPIIMVIGLTLAPGVVGANVLSDDAGGQLWQRIVIAGVVVITMAIVSILAKGFFKLVPILFGIAAGFIVAGVFGFTNFDTIANAPWFIDLSAFKLPEFDITAISLIAPIAIVTFMEHIGDITTNGAVVGKDFLSDPGLNRTLLGDGVATIAAGLLGGPANTTYGENTGVLAVTKNYDPLNIRIAAVVAILLGMFAKVGAFIQVIPGPVMGGISIVLFGMITSIGMRIIGDNKVNLSDNRNLFITSVLIVCGISLNLTVGTATVSGLAIAAVLGIILNLVFPEKKQEDTKETK